MYYKIEAIKIKIPLEKIYERLNEGETLTDIYKQVSASSKAYVDDLDVNIGIPQELLEREGGFVFAF